MALFRLTFQTAFAPSSQETPEKRLKIANMDV
jgi:hypothetical protein